jgi:hypothetical protein
VGPFKTPHEPNWDTHPEKYDTVGGGNNNWAHGGCSTIGGGVLNNAGGLLAAVGGGGNNSSAGESSTIGGGQGNRALAAFATIGGGGPAEEDVFESAVGNFVLDEFGTVGGGAGNRAGGWIADDPRDASYATVAGGLKNAAGARCTAIAGGEMNTAVAPHCFIGGGSHNAARNSVATICGGSYNEVEGIYAGVVSGFGNSATDEGAFVGGGMYNLAGAKFATIAGGAPRDMSDPLNNRNRVTDKYGTIGGGGDNQAGDGVGFDDSAWFATVGGGSANTASADWAVVCGGRDNTASGDESVVAGGAGNVAELPYASIGGGFSNWAKGGHATVAGGIFNQAHGVYSTVGGGQSNLATGLWSTVPGGSRNEATGEYSFAAGRNAKAWADGTFVWADSKEFDVPVTDPDRFVVRATGGVYLATEVDPTSGHVTAGAYLAAGGSTWGTLPAMSDRNLKENFERTDGRRILEQLNDIPVETWNYKGSGPVVRHIGPMAQDFHAAFGVGEDNRHISTMDANGVAFAAIQGLSSIVKEKEEAIASQQRRIAELETENAEIRARLDALESLLAGSTGEREGAGR